ncbi:filamentous hemagglutinin N-terminal domain-containing protein, partial [Pseudoteredinibacter isoporae]|uniref:two-partner secretion domain-containing protein n=1 Tax=Pseudoteredinibacter isoporae TaxID=570281 RepID=UPI001422DFE9
MNHTRKCFSRVAATTKGPRRTLALAVGLAQFFMLSSTPLQVMAAPTGGRVVQGEGFITQGQNVTNVHQNTDLMTVQWDSFDLNQQEIVNFLQPGSHAWVLNHILQNGPSHIDGRINANGNVLLINPRGMIFGDNALINAGSFTASSLWLDKDDFLNGDFYFKDIDSSHGRIVNHGVIAAATGGFINLIGESVSNEGLLSANMGYVSVAAGSEVFLSFDDNNFLGVKVQKAVVNNDPGLQAAIENKGKIEAGTGKVMMNAQSARDLFSQAVNHSGVIEASGFGGAAVDIQANGAVNIEGDINASAGEQGGRINIDADAIELAGKLSANGDRGGQVHLKAEHIGLAATASIDVSGRFGGGQALIGGAYQGGDPNFRNAQTLYMAEGATIYANAIDNGNGGEVILWSDVHTHFYGNVFARGGRLAGNGGFVETSGKKYISLGGFVNTLAPNGDAGTWLVDPDDMTIDDSGSGPNNLTVAQLLTNLQGGNFQISTSGAGSDAGNISILSAIDFSGEAATAGNSLTLLADNNIVIDASVNLLGDLILDAQSAIQINQNITTAGNLSLTMASYALDPAAVLSVTSGLAFNYRSGDQSLDLSTLATELTNVTAGTYTFDLGSGGTDVLSGTTGDDSFTINGANSVQASVGGKSVRFDGLDQLDGGTGNDTINLASSGATINAAGYTSQGIAVSNVLETTATGVLTATANAEVFQVNSDGSIGLNSTKFFGVATLNGGEAVDNSDQDRIVGDINSFQITGNESTVTTTSATSFTTNNVELLESNNNTADLTGENAVNDQFVVQGDRQISAQGMSFSGLDQLAGQAEDTLGAGGFGASLTASGFTTQNVEVNGVASVENTGALTATATPEVFQINNSDGSILVNSISFAGVTTLDGGEAVDNSDQDRIVGDINSFQITGNESTVVTTSATSFTTNNVELLESGNNTADLTGENAVNDQFVVQGDRQISAQGMSFSGLDQLTGQAEDTLGAGGFGASLTASGFTSQNVAVNGVASVENTGALTATATPEVFQINNDGSISVSSISFAGVTTLDGGEAVDNSDQDRIVGDINSFQITGNESTVVTTSTTSFTTNNVELLESSNNTADLTGENAVNDQLVVQGDRQISAQGMSFSGLDQLSAQAEDTFSAGNLGVTLQPTGFMSQNVVVSGVTSVSSTGALVGQSTAESFTSNSAGNVAVSGLNFSGVSSVAGAGGGDSVSLNNANANLNATGFNSNSIDFSGIARALDTGELTATTDPEVFQINPDGSITVSGISFSGVTILDGGEAGDDSDEDRIVGGVNSFQISGNESAVVTTGASSFTANNVELLESSNNAADLLGQSGVNDQFVVQGDRQISAQSMRFSGLDQLTVQAEDTINAGNFGVTLSPGGFTSQNVAVSGASTVSNTGALTGSASNESFNATSANSVSTVGIDFSNVTSVTGGDGSDSVDISNADAVITATGFDSRGISFSDVDAVNNTDVLTGSMSNETFRATADNEITIDIASSDVRFVGVNSVSGGGGNDSVDLNNNNASLISGGFNGRSINFSDIDSVQNVPMLTGTSSDEDFDLSTENTVTVSSTTFSGVNAVVGGSGNDTVNGSNGNESFDATGSERVVVSGIDFTDIEAVTGGGGNDSVNLNNNNASLISGGFNGRSI